MKKSYSKQYQAFNPVDLPDDVDELLELHSQQMSMQVRAENMLNLRRLEMKLLKAKLKEVRTTNEDIQVSDHAVVRYLERVYGIDIKACKQEMLSKLPKDFKWTDEVEFFEIDAKDMRYVLRDKLIITVSPVASAQGGQRLSESSGERLTSQKASHPR